jgi:AraC family transcriptional regulator
MSKPTVEPEERRAQELVHRRARAQIELISPAEWRQIAVSRYRIQEPNIELPPLPVPSISVSRASGHRIQRILRGNRTEGRTVPGHIALLPSDAGTVWALDRGLPIAQLYLDWSLLRRVIEEEIDRDSRGLEIRPDFLFRDQRIERIARDFLVELEAPSIGSQLLVESLTLELAVHLARNRSNLVLHRPERSYSLPPRKLAAARAYIEANLDRRITLDDIAGAVGMSRFHFAKSFETATKKPPYQFVIEQRLEKASRLLLETEDPISTVALAVGYNSQSGFTQAFARHMGTTPARFRNDGRGRDGRAAGGGPTTHGRRP